MTALLQSRLSLLVALVLLHAPVVAWLGLTSPYMHDEVHFAETIRLFADEPTLHTLRTYPEMSTPLPFIVYAAWGKLFSFEPAGQRLLSLLIALVTYGLMHQLIIATLADRSPDNPPTYARRAAFLLTLFIAINPYMLALSVLVYTDMLTILFGVAAMLAWHRRRAAMLGLALAAAVLCRQYAVCYTVAVGTVLLMERVRSRRPDTDRLLLAVVTSIVPMVALAVWWGGLTPDLPRFDAFAGEALRWHPNSFILYVALLSIYLLPLLALRLNRFFGDWRAWLVAGLGGVLYPLAPVRTSPAAELYGADVVGFTDRVVQWFGAIPGRDPVFCAAFMLGTPVVLTLVVDTWRRWRTQTVDAAMLANLTVLFFLLIQPLGSLHWEKYFMLILPAACLAVSSPEKQEV